VSPHKPDRVSGISGKAVLVLHGKLMKKESAPYQCFPEDDDRRFLQYTGRDNLQ